MTRASILAKLAGLEERQAERERRRANTNRQQRELRADALPLHSPGLIARGRRGDKFITPTFETPRTHETHTEIREARRA